MNALGAHEKRKTRCLIFTGPQTVLDREGRKSGADVCAGGWGTASSLPGMWPGLSVYTQLPNHHRKYRTDTTTDFNSASRCGPSGLSHSRSEIQNQPGSPSFPAVSRTDLKETGCRQIKKCKTQYQRITQRPATPGAMYTATLLTGTRSEGLE